MLKCPFCHHQQAIEEANFCTNCGLHISEDASHPSMSDRLKFWGGESRILSVCFVNFVGFEQLTDKQIDSTIMINLRECMIEVEDIIRSHKGTSNEILPDNRVLGIFGAPKAHLDDPLRVIRCAWQIKNWWQRKKKEIEFLKDVEISIGINTGRAFFGYILEKYSFLTVIGDTINTAARLAEICLPNEILISESTYNHIQEYVNTEHMGKRSVKGKTTKIDIYLIKDLKEEAQIVTQQKIPLFGRAAELDKLIEMAGKIKENKVKFCIISGQMGIGKTKIKEEFENYLTDDASFNFIETHCSVDIQSAYFPFKFLLKRYFKLNEFDSKEVISDKLNDIISQKGLSTINAKGLKHLFLTDLKRLLREEIVTINEEIYASVKSLLKHECRNRPLILIFEEFNKADEMSKYLVAYLLSELRNEPIMFLMVNVSRDFMADLDTTIEEINLVPLPLKETRELIEFVLNDVDDKLVEFIYRSAGGNPLFTIETIRNTRRTKLIKKVSGRWYLEKEQRLSFLDDLYGVVMSTIDSLPSDYRLIIDYASVVGYNFSFRILKGLFEGANLKDQLNYLIEEGYIILSKNDKDPVYIFRHNLMKDAAYTVLPLRKRKEIHQIVAKLFEELYADQLSDFYENIGHHYLSCETFKKAAHYFGLAGDKAKNLYALEQALHFYNTVLKISGDIENQIDVKLVRHVFLNMTDLYEITGDIQKMVETAEHGLQSAQQDKDFEYETYFQERYAYALILTNKLAKAEELLLTGVEQCNKKMANILSILHSDLGILYQRKYEYEKSILHYNLSWNTARDNEIKKGEILCLFNLARLHRDLGNYEKSLEYLDYGLNDLIPSDDIRWIIQFKYMIADIYYRIWNVEKAKNILLECFKISNEIADIDIYIKSALALALIASTEKNSKATKKYLECVDKKVSFSIGENLLAEINLKKAIIYNNDSEHKKAKDFIMSTLKTAQKYNQKENEFYCYDLLSQVETKASFDHAKTALDIAERTKLPPLIASALFRMTQIFIQEDDAEKTRHYGRKALLMYDDVKFRLNEENRQVYSRRPEYSKLLEI